MEACNSSYKPIKTQVIQSENVNREIEDENNHCRFGTYSHYWFSRKKVNILDYLDMRFKK